MVIPFSIDTTTLVLKASENGISLMGVLTVVQYGHKTLDNSSSQRPFKQSSLFYYAQEGSVSDFHLAVCLGVSKGREVILDAELCTEFLVLGIVELFTVVSNNDLKDVKSAHNGLSGEVLDVLLGDLHQGFNLYPLGEVIDGHY